MAQSSASKTRSLVIVESPAKARTINKYLGQGFEVKASMGHIRDLPATGLNVDIDNGFKPTYEVVPGRKRIVTSLKAVAEKCDSLYLATDLDREGEAIAWHLAQLLQVPQEKTYRVIFNAITESAIKNAFANPGRLDMDKVMAQQARRIIDRIVGYQVSPLLWKKIARGLSAGRVQSVAVKIIVQRERQIRQFKREEYWLIPAVFTTDLGSDYRRQWLQFLGSAENGKSPTALEQNKWLAENNAFKAELELVADKKFKASTHAEAEPIFRAIETGRFTVADVQTKRSLSKPAAPFITSSLQQTAANMLGFSPKKTMLLAQQLYEGIELGSMGALGLITYMRTDSTHLSGEAISDARRYIAANINPSYIPEKPNIYAAAKHAQQAHEAIRPTDPDFAPEDVKSFLTDGQLKLYDLIWRRFIACQMAPAQWDTTAVEVRADTPIGPCVYRAAGRVLVFEGFTRIWPTSFNEPQLPQLNTGQSLAVVDIQPEQHFTKPPARFTEASLVKAMEKEGIGRPSTYATIVSTIQERGYVEQLDRKLYSTDIAEIVTEKLQEYFPQIMDLAFTRHMEEQLDKIEENHLDWLTVLREFYNPFKHSLEKATELMKHAKAETKPSEYTCPLCGQPLVYKFGKNARFLSCSGYPKCRFASPCDKQGKMLEEKPTGVNCPNCGKPLTLKHGPYGPFLGCSDYPKCKTILKLGKDGQVMPPKPAPEPTGIKCHKCEKGELLIRQGKRGPFLGCGRFPRCRTIISIKQLEYLKALQAKGQWPPQTPELADELLGKKKKKAGIKHKKSSNAQ
jgi:DNA topoisomerase-1